MRGPLLITAAAAGLSLLVGASLASRPSPVLAVQERDPSPGDDLPDPPAPDQLPPGTGRDLVDLLRERLGLTGEDEEIDVGAIVEGLPGPEDLARRRQEIAEQMMEGALQQFVLTPSPTARRDPRGEALTTYLEWSSHRLDAMLERAGSDEARAEAIAREIAKIGRIEEGVAELERGAGSGITRRDLLEMEFRRLSLQSRLARLAGGESIP